jgi:hypothetical protein
VSRDLNLRAATVAEAAARIGNRRYHAAAALDCVTYRQEAAALALPALVARGLGHDEAAREADRYAAALCLALAGRELREGLDAPVVT